MVRGYDALLTFGSAVNEETLTLPEHVYKRLDQTAEIYTQSAALGSEPLVIVSGFQRARRVYRNNLLKDENGQPLRECDPMAKYLHERYGIVALREGQAASIGDNLAYSKLMLLEQPPIERACIVTLDPLRPRIEALAQKVFGNFCTIDVEAIETDAEFPSEARLFGDHLCMLKPMDSGDHTFLVDPANGSSLWDQRAKEHAERCEHLVNKAKSLPFTNNHPAYAMEALLASL